MQVSDSTSAIASQVANSKLNNNPEESPGNSKPEPSHTPKGDSLTISQEAKELHFKQFEVDLAKLAEKNKPKPLTEEELKAQEEAIRAEAKDAHANFSGTTEKNTTYKIYRSAIDNKFYMNFTRADGTEEHFNFNNGIGFTEKEDGTIVQFGSKYDPKAKEQDESAYALIGTEGQDIIVNGLGGRYASGIKGMGGNDLIINAPRNEGDVHIDGGDGDDTIFSGRYGVSGRLLNQHSEGKVNVDGGNGNDTIIFKGAEPGKVSGGNGDDIMQLSASYFGNAYISGGAGNDRISVRGVGGGSNINGDVGDDFISIEGGHFHVNNVHGGDGHDTIEVTSKSRLWIQDVTGGDGNDVMKFHGETVILEGDIDGGKGDDYIEITGDTIKGEVFRIFGGDGNNEIKLEAKEINLKGGIISGADKLTLRADNITLDYMKIFGDMIQTYTKNLKMFNTDNPLIPLSVVDKVDKVG